jgi:hypothetical protein
MDSGGTYQTSLTLIKATLDSGDSVVPTQWSPIPSGLGPDTSRIQDPGPPGQTVLPKVEGPVRAGRLFFASCWCFGESLPLKIAGAVAVVTEAWSEAVPAGKKEGGKRATL